MWNFPGTHCNTKYTSGWVQLGYLSTARAAELALQVRLKQHCSVRSATASTKCRMKDRTTQTQSSFFLFHLHFEKLEAFQTILLFGG